MATHPDGRHGGCPDGPHWRRRDIDGCIFRRPVADRHRVAALFVEGLNVRRAQDDLVVRLDRVTVEDERRQGSVGRGQEDGDGQAVDLDVGERVSGPCGDVGVTTEELAHRWRDVAGAGRVDAIGPVPSVEIGM